MITYKKIIKISLISTISLALYACGSNSSKETVTAVETSNETIAIKEDIKGLVEETATEKELNITVEETTASIQSEEIGSKEITVFEDVITATTLFLPGHQ